MAIIVLQDIGFMGRHGVTAAERQSTRPFRVDVTLEQDVSRAESSDDLTDTIDYQRVAEIVVRLGEGPPHHLIESLGRAMLGELSATFPGARIMLELRKLSPPGCPGSPAWAAVRLVA